MNLFHSGVVRVAWISFKSSFVINPLVRFATAASAYTKVRDRDGAE